MWFSYIKKFSLFFLENGLKITLVSSYNYLLHTLPASAHIERQVQDLWQAQSLPIPYFQTLLKAYTINQINLTSNILKFNKLQQIQ